MRGILIFRSKYVTYLIFAHTILNPEIVNARNTHSIKESFKYSNETADQAYTNSIRILDKAIEYHKRLVNINGSNFLNGKNDLKKKNEVIDLAVKREIAAIEFLNSTLSFCKNFSNDDRKFILLQLLLGHTQFINFWKDIPKSARALSNANGLRSSYTGDFNWHAYNEYIVSLQPLLTELYESFLKKEGVEEGIQSKINMKLKLLSQYMLLSKNTSFRKVGKADLYEIHKLFIDASELANYNNFRSDYKKFFWVTKTINFWLLSAYEQYGWNEKDLKTFISITDTVAYPGLGKWARQWENVINLKHKPFSFTDTTLNGDILTFDQYRGKITLVDFWSLSCGDCIAKMPYLKKLYEKYQNDGFEIISVCAAKEFGKDLEKVKKLDSSINGRWPTLVIGTTDDPKSLARQTWDLYGFHAVPQLLLFDKNGRLIMINDQLTDTDFEELLTKWL